MMLSSIPPRSERVAYVVLVSRRPMAPPRPRRRGVVGSPGSFALRTEAIAEECFVRSNAPRFENAIPHQVCHLVLHDVYAQY